MAGPGVWPPIGPLGTGAAGMESAGEIEFTPLRWQMTENHVQNIHSVTDTGDKRE